MLTHRFNSLLVMLILLLLALPVMRHLGYGARLAINLLFLGVMISAVYAVSDRRTHLIVAGLLAFAATALRCVTLLSDEADHPIWRAVGVARLTLDMAYFAVVIVLIVQHVLSSTLVTTDMICASLCAYLLLGVLWAEAFIMVETIETWLDLPATFSNNVDFERTEDLPLSERHDQLFMTAIYLSYVTLATLGYGDITPLSDAARMLAVVEAIVGQFYLTVLVARLIGLHISRQKGDLQ